MVTARGLRCVRRSASAVARHSSTAIAFRHDGARRVGRVYVFGRSTNAITRRGNWPVADIDDRERKLNDQWERGRLIPLPSILFDRSLSNKELQDRWTAAAEKKWDELREKKQAILADLADVNAALKDAEEFVLRARQAQQRYRENEVLLARELAEDAAWKPEPPLLPLPRQPKKSR